MSRGIAGGRVIVFKMDSHGCYVDPKAYKAFLDDLKILRPNLEVNMGDGLDAGGVFTSHRPSYLKEMDYSYEADCEAANAQLDAELKYCERVIYIQGNHEARIEAWCVAMMGRKSTAQTVNNAIAPEKMLRLKERGVKFIRRDECYDGLANPGTIRIGKLHAQHGYSIAKHAAAQHLADLNESVVFGHVHRTQSHVSRTIRNQAIGAWSSGCLSQLQPYWQHSKPTGWTHGYGLAFLERDGRFLYFSVPIVDGWSGLRSLLHTIKPQRFAA